MEPTIRYGCVSVGSSFLASCLLTSGLHEYYRYALCDFGQRDYRCDQYHPVFRPLHGRDSQCNPDFDGKSDAITEHIDIPACGCRKLFLFQTVVCDGLDTRIKYRKDRDTDYHSDNAEQTAEQPLLSALSVIWEPI